MKIIRWGMTGLVHQGDSRQAAPVIGFAAQAGAAIGEKGIVLAAGIAAAASNGGKAKPAQAVRHIAFEIEPEMSGAR